MKLRNFLTENDKATLSKFFDLSDNAKVNFTPNGCDVDGNVFWKSTAIISFSGAQSLPVKFNVVTGTFDVTGAPITDFNNFPISVMNLKLSKLDNVTSMKGLENIEVTGRLTLNDTKFTDLTFSPETDNLELFNNSNLSSINGLRLKANDDTSVHINNCPKLTDISILVNNPNCTLVISITPDTAVSLVEMILNDRAIGKKVKGQEQLFKEYERIRTTFAGKGWGSSIELIRSLRDAGLTNAARIQA